MNIGSDYPPPPLLNPPVVSSIQQPPSLIQMYADSKAASAAASGRENGRDPGLVYIEKKKGNLFRIAVIATIAFVVLSNNIAYKVVNQLYSAVTGNINHIMGEDGCPTYKGLLVHTGVFFVLMILLLFT